MSLASLGCKASAFLKRDFRAAASYQLSFFLTCFNSLFLLAMLYFIGGMIAPTTAGLGKGGSYFAFALVGYGFYQYFNLALGSFSSAIQTEQLSGSLEALMATRTRPELSILLSSLYGFVSSLIQLAIIFAFGGLVFGVDLSKANLPVALLSFALSTAVFTGFGILSAAFIVLFKKGDPLGWVLMTLNFVFGGAFFPLEQMPAWMRGVAAFVPATYALDALRAAILDGAGVAELARPLAALGLAAILLLPLSLRLFALAVEKAKRDGSLVFY